MDPLLILHSYADATVFYADSLAFIEKMIAQQKQLDFMPMPAASHVWAEGDLARLRFGYRKIAEFFDQHLQP